MNAPPSSLHSKVLPDSVEVKLKLALALADGLGGKEVMVVSGGVVSGRIVQENEAGLGSMFPAISMARAWKL